MPEYNWLNALPEPETAKAPEPKERTMPSGPKGMQLPQNILDRIASPGEWFSQSGLPDGKAASAFLYAVRKAAKEDGHGLNVVVDEPENALLKDLRTLEGPITLRMSSTPEIIKGRGRKAGTVTDVTPEPDEIDALIDANPTDGTSDADRAVSSSIGSLGFGEEPFRD